MDVPRWSADGEEHGESSRRTAGQRHDEGPRKPASKTRWILVVVGALVLGLIGMKLAGVSKGHSAGGAASASASAERVTPVTTVMAEKRDVPVVLEGLGTVTPVASVMVRSQVDGQLKSVAFVEGQDVKKGDLIAQIDPRPFSIQLQSAQAGLARDQATLDNARSTLARNEALVSENLLSRQELDNQAAAVASSRATLLTDQANIAQARLQLDYARIRSPIDGVAGVRLVDPGNLVRASDTSGIVLITQLDPIAVLFSLPQDDLPRIQKQLSAGVVVTEAYARDGQTRLATGKLALIDNQVIAQTGTVRLKAIFPNPERQLWPNAFVKARLQLEVKQGALVVPAAAVQRGPNGTYLYVLGPDRTAVMKPVTVTFVQGEQAILAPGTVNPGDAVIVDGQTQLKPGGKVAPRGAAGAGSAMAPRSADPLESARPPAAGYSGSAAAGSARPPAPGEQSR